jgi:hypothetical protein
MKSSSMPPRTKPMARTSLRVTRDVDQLSVKLPKRICKNRACRNKFVPSDGHPFAIACCTDCEIILSKRYVEKLNAARAKMERKELAERKEAIKPLHYFAKRAEKACNAFIRFRDAGDPCISCGTYDAPEWHAGHCYTVAARPDIRYHEDNIHLQCPKCNTYQGGMVGAYKIRVVSKIGQERLDALAYVNPAFKKTREYYQAIEAHYKAKIKQLGAAT